MAGQYVATSTVTIEAPPDRVWERHHRSCAVKEFMFGADLVTDWTVGGPILWRGEWEGKPYEDKGKILEVEPGGSWSTRTSARSAARRTSRKTTTPSRGRWRTRSGATQLTLSQDNNPSEEAAEHSKGMWDKLVADVKKIAERG